MKTKQLLFLVAPFFLVTGCLNNSDKPPVYEDVEGMVTSNGEPVNNASIHIRNHFNPGGFIVSGQGEEDLTISVNIQDEGLYTGNLYRNGSDTVLATFFNDSLQTGQQEISIPDSLLSNGIFGYEVRNTAVQVAGNLFVISKPDTALPESLPFTRTNANGEFNLNIHYLSIGQSFITGSGGFEVTDSLEIIITDGENVLETEKVKVEPNQVNYFEIILN
ncbi:MAG: hypothetical protein HUJ22_11125 [Gracilimonas sp.]|uniref:hypothetical protein n=1 Tax=Gracilimonas sp. TaxID=1974203 RepID=UPI0019C0E805|nr:hypothetical protein [Gracilimonas sp.]MBD3617110.1 hypothetical protein [Gracilimonas sp.]